jgi:hypothetical protein
MNKKYIISNSQDSSNSINYYLLYIIIIIATVCLFWQFLYSYNEDFATNIPTTTPTITLSPYINNLNTYTSNTSNEKVKNLTIENEQLSNTLTTLEQKLKLQNKLQYISDNYMKVNQSTFPDELNLINLYFSSIDLPQIDISTYNIISTDADFKTLVNEAGKFVNIYKPGDIVTSDSSFNVDRNDICYKNINDPSYKKSHPDCMVCSVNSDYLNSPSWNNLKTNINTVCLFDNNAIQNSGIPSASDCKKLCNINQ